MNFDIFSEDRDPLPIPMRFIFVLILLVFLVNMTIPQAALAEINFATTNDNNEFVIKSSEKLDLLSRNFIDYENKQNELKYQAPIRVVTVIATAYSSTVEQCDSTPCITASGYNVCEHGEENIIAANFLPLGAKVRIPDLYGTKVFTVEDRMNPRYDARIDLWKKDRNTAITFGKRLVKIEVVEY